MGDTSDHPQLDELVQRLNAERSCAIVHVESRREVLVWAGRTSGLAAQATAKDEPATEVKQHLRLLGFEVTRDEHRLAGVPAQATPITMNRVYGEFADAHAAARGALALFQILWDVSPTEWLWVTASEYEKRGEPKRPASA